MATVGDTGAPSTNTIYYDALLTTTLDAWVGGGSLFDQIFKDSAFLSLLRLSDAVIRQNGGERIRVPLLYGKNETIKSYSGYETLDTTPQEGLTTAFYEWREIGGTISISRKEERQNSGEAAKIALLGSKIEQAKMSMTEELSSQIVLGTVNSSTFVPGNDSKDMNPLGYFLRKKTATDPVAGGNVGNIASSNSWWRAKSAAFGGSSEAGGVAVPTVTTYKGIVVALRRLYNYCSQGSGGSPNIFLFDQISYETYENALDEKVRYSNTKLADMGFDNIKLRGATCIWDEIVPDVENGTAAVTLGTVFALNTKFFKLVIDSETDVVTTPFVTPENQTAKTAKILFMGNTVCSNLRKQGVGYEILGTIVT
ncbi:MAG TPA: phage major capsid protein [Marinobacter sp.]|uniref:Phage major capsid protein n=1 Tax=marine sediment metagenome TaxID=412755 RepID=A0A0F9LCQ1_9ZZZZ|nr:phage major capsid protein [Marinobacter sp.]